MKLRAGREAIEAMSQGSATQSCSLRPAGAQRSLGGRWMIGADFGAMNGEESAAVAARELAARTGGGAHEVAVVLGSGWAGSAELLGTPLLDLATEDLPGFAASEVAGHAGRIRSLEVHGCRVLTFLGRTHLYERRDPTAVSPTPLKKSPLPIRST